MPWPYGRLVAVQASTLITLQPLYNVSFDFRWHAVTYQASTVVPYEQGSSEKIRQPTGNPTSTKP